MARRLQSDAIYEVRIFEPNPAGFQPIWL